MKVFLLSLAVIGLCVFGMCFNIIFRKDGKFPEFDVGSNEEMRKRGIRCFKDEDAQLHSRSASSDGKIQEHCSGTPSEACRGCFLYDAEH